MQIVGVSYYQNFLIHESNDSTRNLSPRNKTTHIQITCSPVPKRSIKSVTRSVTFPQTNFCLLVISSRSPGGIEGYQGTMPNYALSGVVSMLIENITSLALEISYFFFSFSFCSNILPCVPRRSSTPPYRDDESTFYASQSLSSPESVKTTV